MARARREPQFADSELKLLGNKITRPTRALLRRKNGKLIDTFGVDVIALALDCTSVSVLRARKNRQNNLGKRTSHSRNGRSIDDLNLDNFFLARNKPQLRQVQASILQAARKARVAVDYEMSEISAEEDEGEGEHDDQDAMDDSEDQHTMIPETMSPHAVARHASGAPTRTTGLRWPPPPEAGHLGVTTRMMEERTHEQGLGVGAVCAISEPPPTKVEDPSTSKLALPSLKAEEPASHDVLSIGAGNTSSQTIPAAVTEKSKLVTVAPAVEELEHRCVLDVATPGDLSCTAAQIGTPTETSLEGNNSSAFNLKPTYSVVPGPSYTLGASTSSPSASSHLRSASALFDTANFGCETLLPTRSMIGVTAEDGPREATSPLVHVRPGNARETLVGMLQSMMPHSNMSSCLLALNKLDIWTAHGFRNFAALNEEYRGVVWKEIQDSLSVRELVVLKLCAARLHPASQSSISHVKRPGGASSDSVPEDLVQMLRTAIPGVDLSNHRQIFVECGYKHAGLIGELASWRDDELKQMLPEMVGDVRQHNTSLSGLNRWELVALRYALKRYKFA
uniref:Uncharacterized protein n=1 Tax=Mycena chlorophos TaxID=658473 RepID=A0ABQ0L408_MYCCL|nr:predicted protein [Mycena chlorophos]